MSFTLTAQSALTKRVDFETKNTPISEALINLSEAANINIAFHPRLFSKDQTVSLSIRQQPILTILKECLATTNITFKFEGEHLILYEKPKQYYTLSGYIEDAQTGERLVAATIWEASSGKGTTTNDYGFFSLKVQEGTLQLQSSYLGYQGQVQTLKHSRSQKITIALAPSITLEEIIITDREFEKKEAHIALGKGAALSLNAIKNSVPLAGESDVMRYMNTLANVQSGTDGFGGLHVRGGNADQNLVLMDGVPIYNPSHTLGLFSIFNTNIVKSAHLLKDGFSAKYGGRLSSVMNIRIKEGNTKGWSGEGEIGTLATKLLIEGPIKNEQTGLLIAARRTHLDPLIGHISSRQKRNNEEEGKVDYHFSDFNAKLHHRFSAKDQLFTSFYSGRDIFRDNSYYEYEIDEPDFYYYWRIEDREQQIKWGNKIAALRWNHLFNDRLFSNTTVTYSNYDYSSLNIEWLFIDDEFEDLFIDDFHYTTFQSKIKDAGVKMDFEYYPSTNFQFLFGGGFLSRSFASGILEELLDSAPSETSLEETEESFDEIYDLPRFVAQEANIYFENKVALSDQLSFMGGIHLAAFFTDQRNYFLPQPRFHLLWKMHPEWQTTLSGSTMAQFLHILSTSGSGLPNDLWVPSTQNVRPQESWQFTWGTSFRSNGWGTTVDTYYKKLNHLIAYGETASLPSLFEFDPSFWEEEITTGQGESYGISTTLEKYQGKLTGQLNYAYTISERQFDNLNNDQPYPFRFNHPHEIKITGQYQINERTAFNFNWQYGSGQPISLIKTNTRFAPLNNLYIDETERIGAINSSSLPAYHRLDIGVSFQWNHPTLAHHLHLGAYNLYNRKNPYYIYLYEDEFFPEDSGQRQQNGLPLLPSVSYKIVFN